MVIFHISDWHGLTDSLENQFYFEARSAPDKPDLIVITGDMIANFRPSLRDLGNEEIIQSPHLGHLIDAIDEMYPGVDIVGVRGNHDWCDYTINGMVAFDSIEGGSIEVNGLKISGFRGVTAHTGFWKDEYPEPKLAMLCDLVPKDTDILITHCPPFGILDDRKDVEFLKTMPDLDPDFSLTPHGIGSTSIRDLVDGMPNLRAHLFGHCHEQGGKVRVSGKTIFSNAAGTMNVVYL